MNVNVLPHASLHAIAIVSLVVGHATTLSVKLGTGGILSTCIVAADANVA